MFPDFSGLYFFETRFLKDHFYVCAQTWYWIPATTSEKIQEGTVFNSIVCAHLNSKLRKMNAFSAAFNRNLDFLEKNAGLDWPEACTGLLHCPLCPTEVALQTKRPPRDLSGGGFIVATKWQIIGYGVSPAEPAWKQPLNPTTVSPWLYGPEDLPGRIRDDFENSVGAKYDSSTNASKAKKILDQHACAQTPGWGGQFRI